MKMSEENNNVNFFLPHTNIKLRDIWKKLYLFKILSYTELKLLKIS